MPARLLSTACRAAMTAPLLTALALLGGCGQSGALYFPEQDARPAAKTTAPAVSDTDDAETSDHANPTPADHDEP